MDVAADQAPGIGRTGMTSTDSPGKIVKCGCFSNSLAAASCDSARTTMKAPISLLTSSMPRPVIFFVLPSGPPMAETAAWCFSTQAFQAAMPCCSLARLSASGSAIHAFMRELVLLPRKTARYVSFVVMRFPFLYGLWAETRVRNSGAGAPVLLLRCRHRMVLVLDAPKRPTVSPTHICSRRLVQVGDRRRTDPRSTCIQPNHATAAAAARRTRRCHRRDLAI